MENTTNKKIINVLLECINQSLDLAKLSQNLLKGEELTSFIKRSLDLIN